jgi:hypothetical protein
VKTDPGLDQDFRWGRTGREKTHHEEDEEDAAGRSAPTGSSAELQLDHRVFLYAACDARAGDIP